jgi:hypothetical protein
MMFKYLLLPVLAFVWCNARMHPKKLRPLLPLLRRLPVALLYPAQLPDSLTL